MKNKTTCEAEEKNEQKAEHSAASLKAEYHILSCWLNKGITANKIRMRAHLRIDCIKNCLYAIRCVNAGLAAARRRKRRQRLQKKNKSEKM